MFNASDIDRLIEEDVPYFDLTSHILGIENIRTRISFFSRDNITVCGTEECLKIFSRFNVEPKFYKRSGEEIEKGEEIIVGEGRGSDVHKVWKVCQNLLEYASGIATKTKNLVAIAKKANPKIAVVTTRKTFPLGKKICIKGILCGGALPHRLGLSETVLIFKNHYNLLGGFNSLISKIKQIKEILPEKKIVVEAENPEEAKILIDYGVDVVQLDKFPVKIVQEIIEYRNKNAPAVKIAVAGGIDENNIESYAATGADIIVLTSAYLAKPADIGVKIEKC